SVSGLKSRSGPDESRYGPRTRPTLRIPMRTLARYTLILAVASLTALLSVSAASAATPSTGATPGTSPTGGGLGPWYPAPGDGSSVGVYQGDLVPYTASTPEALNFSCTYPAGSMRNGMEVDDEVLAVVGQIFRVAHGVYNDPHVDQLKDSVGGKSVW